MVRERSSAAAAPPPPPSRVEEEALRVARDPILRKMLEEERVESAEVDSRLFLRLLSYVRAHPWLLTLALTLAFLEAVVMVLPAWLIGVAVDALFFAGATGEGWASALHGLAARQASLWWPSLDGAQGVLLAFTLMLASAWSFRWLVAVTTTYLVQMLGQRVVHQLRGDVFRHVVQMDTSFFLKNPVGRLVNRTTFDVQNLSELFSDALAQGVRDLFFVAVLALVMLRLDLQLALILIASFPFLLGVAALYRRLARPSLRTHSAVQSRMNAWLAENMAGMRENQLYGKELRRREELRALTDAHQASIRRVIQAWGLVRPGLMLTSAFATAGILWFGMLRVEAGLLSVGLLLTFLQYASRIWVPVRNLAEKVNLIQTALTSGERVMDILDAAPELTDLPTADPQRTIHAGEITFTDVRFRYPGTERDVLRAVSFHARPGEMIALVGDTGAGKSTIISLLARFYDVSEGQVQIDGSDVRDYTLRGLRSAIALVPQDVVIFAESIRENITLGRPIDDATLWRCLDAMGARDLVERFPEGLDHVLQEGGRTWSLGERQLLSFARALVINPPVLILDEATANIDSENEARLQRALEELTRGRTSVVIAHRLSTIRHADQILVLREGRVVERGRHEALLESGGEYARLHRLYLGAQERG